MTSEGFPTRLADLTLNDANHNPSLYASLKSIRKAALSIPHRLGSVLADARFAKQVSDDYQLPLVANERCGSWYIDPVDKVGSAYFKSTDGHHGQWDLSLRRLNLQLLGILGRDGGAVVVDSTRRGKNLPDAFGKTVPIWVAVINRALFPELGSTHRLQTAPAPDNLGESEIAQIEGRLEAFKQSFVRLGLDLLKLRNELKHPIRLTWAINGCYDGANTTPPPATPGERDFQLLVLCSASRRVRGAEASEGGYIQGAGDDSEGWSHGLTPALFWKHRELLMGSPEDELPSLITELLEQDRQSIDVRQGAVRILPASNIYVGVGMLAHASGFDLVINCHGGDTETAAPRVLFLRCRSGKTGSKDLREKLPGISDAVGRQLRRNPQSQVLVTCDTGRDLSVGIVTALLCLYYDDKGAVLSDDGAPLPRAHGSDGGCWVGKADKAHIDKQLVKQRLAWVTCSKPDANPSRATLQAINSFLMERPD